MITVIAAVRDQGSARAEILVPVGTTPRKIDHAPAEVTHSLAAGRYQSPLRYPGAKSGLSNVIGELIAAAQRSAQVRRVDLLVEPFAGGASTTLRLVGAGIVERALLADADPMVAAFWQVAASRTQELVERITDEHTTHVAAGGATALARWDYWRAWSAAPGTSRSTEDLELATKCMFLNRTTFSGILHGQAGPIGGRAQTSEYGIGCRFNLKSLVERLEYIGHLYDTRRIADVWRSDWKTTLHGVASHYKTLLPDRVVAYLDPPYLSKSGKLYRGSVDGQAAQAGKDLDWMGTLQHHHLAEYLRQEMQYRWILSYDYDERLLTENALYAAKAMHPSRASRDLNGVKSWRISKRIVTLNYTASSRTGRGPAQELLLTTLPPATVPTNERLLAASPD
ncbi:DNA adenine methylase [Micromonospora sp. NPDC049801]|uniref:DNA adenine methylase n=1 Tax=unclassified Micromonospora TaxID=2617518 RepID=UPI0033C20559